MFTTFIIVSLFLLLFLVLAFSGFTFIRNEAVYKMRLKIIREDFERHMEDLEHHAEDLKNRMEDLNSSSLPEYPLSLSRLSSLPPYNSMVLHFWIPLSRYEQTIKGEK